MKKAAFLAAAALLLLLSGCAKTASGTDCAYQYNGFLNIASLQESGETYYFATHSRMFIIDKETRYGTYLCSKPNCLHEAEEDPSVCGSWFAFGASAHAPLIFHSGSKLYYICKDSSDAMQTKDILAEMDEDGEKRKIICAFPEGFRTVSAVLHRGKIYASLVTFSEDTSQSYVLVRADIGTGKIEELVRPEKNVQLDAVTAYENFVYYQKSTQDANGAVQKIEVERLDTATRKCMTIPEPEADWWCTYVTFVQGRLLLRTIRPSELQTDGVCRVYLCDPDGSDAELIIEGRGTYASDGERIYCSRLDWSRTYEYDTPPEPSALIIYSPQGEELGRVELASAIPERFTMLSVFPTAGDTVLFSVLIGRENRQDLYCFPKSEIGTGRIDPVFLGGYSIV